MSLYFFGCETRKQTRGQKRKPQSSLATEEQKGLRHKKGEVEHKRSEPRRRIVLNGSKGQPQLPKGTRNQRCSCWGHRNSPNCGKLHETTIGQIRWISLENRATPISHPHRCRSRHRRQGSTKLSEMSSDGDLPCRTSPAGHTLGEQGGVARFFWKGMGVRPWAQYRSVKRGSNTNAVAFGFFLQPR